MDILPLLDEIQTIARKGLNFTPNPYDRERYERLLEVVAAYYGQTLDLPPPEVRRRLIGELGYTTPKVGAHAAIFDAADGILVVRRADDGRWCLPCGWVEPNEAPDETVVQEVREETGLDIRVRRLTGFFASKADSGHGPHSAIAVGYHCEVVGGYARASHEVLEIRYGASKTSPPGTRSTWSMRWPRRARGVRSSRATPGTTWERRRGSDELGGSIREAHEPGAAVAHHGTDPGDGAAPGH